MKEARKEGERGTRTLSGETLTSVPSNLSTVYKNKHKNASYGHILHQKTDGVVWMLKGGGPTGIWELSSLPPQGLLDGVWLP